MTEPVSGGATNDSAEDLIRKHLPGSLTGRAWEALIAALAVGDELNWTNAKRAFDQLFKTSASGLYLTRKANDDGLSKPLKIGMSDELFRQLAIKTTSKKLTQQSLLEILEVFYGPDAVRASITTTLAEPFDLTALDPLELLLDEKDSVTIVFRAADFSTIGEARAEEVAAAINRVLRSVGSKAYAIALTDTETDDVRVRVYSGSLGLSSGMRVTGGRAQLALEFESKLATYSATITGADSYDWDVTNPEAGVNRVALTTTGMGKVDLSVLRAGDYVIFEAANSTIPDGTYEILDVGISYSGANPTQYFEIEGDVAGHTFLQLSGAEMVFFRPERQAVHQELNRFVAVAQTQPQDLDIVLPATTQAVGRRMGTGSYLQTQEAQVVDALVRKGTTVTVTTDSAHGLSTGQHVLIEGAKAGHAAADITAGDEESSGTPGTTDASLTTIWSSVRVQEGVSVEWHTLTKLSDGRILLVGGSQGNPVVSCSLFEITDTDTLPDGSTQYTYNWEAADDLPQATAQHSATLLEDGRVLVAGGVGAAATYLETHIYNTDSEQWEAGPDMDDERAQHTATLLDDGTVLIAGGHEDEAAWLDACEIFNPASDTLSATGSLNQARYGHKAVLLEDGRVLVIGGNDGTKNLATCEIWDSGTWTNTGAMTFSRYGHEAVRLPDGRVLVTGGQGKNPSHAGELDSDEVLPCEIYNPATGRWAAAGKLTQGRIHHSATFMPDSGLVVVAGGSEPVPPAEGLTSRSTPFTEDAYTIANNGAGTWVVAGDNGQLASSTDGGVTWTSRTSQFGTSNIRKIIWAESKFVAVGGDGGAGLKISTSADGITWTARTPPTFASQTDETFYDITYDGSNFFAVGGTVAGPGILGASSVDGVTWVGQIPVGGEATPLNTISWLNSAYFLTTNGTNIFRSINLNSWGDVGAVGTSLKKFAYGSALYVTAGGAGQIFTSPTTDAASWTSRTSQFGADDIEDLIFANSIFVAVGEAGKISTSTNGTAWTARTSGVADRLMTVIWTGTHFLAFGENGAFVASEDGITWEVRDSDTAEDLSDVAFDASTDIIAVSGTNSQVSSGELAEPAPDALGRELTEYFNPDTYTWSRAPMTLPDSEQYRFARAVAVTDKALLLCGGDGTAASEYPNQMLIQDSDTYGAGGLNGIFKLTSATGSTLTFETPEVSSYSENVGADIALTEVAAPEDTGIAGPYLMDPDNGLAVTGIESTITQDLFEGHQYATLAVADASDFPDAAGWLVIGFGHEGQAAPIKYLGRASATSLTLDYQQRMPATNLSGASVILLDSKGAFVPEDPEELGLFYLTASPAGRVAAQEAVEASVAAGINTEVTVLYPGDQGLGNAGTAFSDETWVWGGDEE